MSETASKLKTEQGSEKSFGIVFSVVFLIIALYPLSASKDPHIWALIVSVILLLLALGIFLINTIRISKKDRHKFDIPSLNEDTEKKDLDVEVQENTLSISYDSSNKEESDNKLYRGIAQRSFRRQFSLSEDVEVTGAIFKNGLLQIDLERIIPEEKRPKQIKIK